YKLFLFLLASPAVLLGIEPVRCFQLADFPTSDPAFQLHLSLLDNPFSISLENGPTVLPATDRSLDNPPGFASPSQKKAQGDGLYFHLLLHCAPPSLQEKPIVFSETRD